MKTFIPMYLLTHLLC